MQQVKYSRVLLKLSGEALMGDGQEIFDNQTINGIVCHIKQLTELNVKLGIVIGGGNILRGVNANKFGLQRTNADYMGMLATIINGIALKDFLTSCNIRSKIYSALPVANLIPGFNRDNMLDHLEDNNVIIFVGGTGNPCFTTDSCAALRAVEMKADLLIKATKVNGIYESDPKQNTNARRYTSISFDEVIKKQLKVMDITAFDLCYQHKINIEVCSIFEPESLKNAINGNSQGTLVHI